MNKGLVVLFIVAIVVIAVFAVGSITGNGILDWFKGKKSPAQVVKYSPPNPVVKAGTQPAPVRSNPLASTNNPNQQVFKNFFKVTKK